MKTCSLICKIIRHLMNYLMSNHLYILHKQLNAVQSGERCAAIVSHNQPSDISDDILCQSVTEVSKQPIALCR